MDKLSFINEVSSDNWDEMVDKYGIRYGDVFSKNTKYTIETENGKECSCYTISNGNAFDCPALKQGKCNVPCYGLKGCYRWDTPKIVAILILLELTLQCKYGTDQSIR